MCNCVFTYYIFWRIPVQILGVKFQHSFSCMLMRDIQLSTLLFTSGTGNWHWTKLPDVTILFLVVVMRELLIQSFDCKIRQQNLSMLWTPWEKISLMTMTSWRNGEELCSFSVKFHEHTTRAIEGSWFFGKVVTGSVPILGYQIHSSLLFHKMVYFFQPMQYISHL